MAKRIVRELPNGRFVTQGLVRPQPYGPYLAVIAEGEADIIRIELTTWLDASETVSSSALSDQSGATISKSNGSTYVDLTVSGVTDCGRATLTITTSAGRIKVVDLQFATPQAAAQCDAYRCCA